MAVREEIVRGFVERTIPALKIIAKRCILYGPLSPVSAPTSAPNAQVSHSA